MRREGHAAVPGPHPIEPVMECRTADPVRWLRTQHEGCHVNTGNPARVPFGGDVGEPNVPECAPVTLRAREFRPRSPGVIAALPEQGFNALKLLPGPVPEFVANFCDMQGST